MAYMSDEKYEYIQDIKEKNHTAKRARIIEKDIVARVDEP